jgi:hypothetical protein
MSFVGRKMCARLIAPLYCALGRRLKHVSQFCYYYSCEIMSAMQNRMLIRMSLCRAICDLTLASYDRFAKCIRPSRYNISYSSFIGGITTPIPFREKSTH